MVTALWSQGAAAPPEATDPMHARLPAHPLLHTLLALALLTACSPANEGGDAGDVVADNEVDAVVDTTVDTAGNPDTDAGGAQDSTPTALDAPLGSNLHVRIEGPAHLKGKLLEVVLVEGDVVQAGLYALGPEHELHKGPATELPLDLFTAAPAGDWIVRAIALGPQGGDEWLAVGLSCGAAGALGQVSISQGGPLQSISATLKDDEGIEGFDQVCGGQPATFLRPQVEVATPPVDDATAHYMAGVAHEDRYWLAAYQDGVSSFYLPPGGEVDEDNLAQWTISGGAFCSRILRHGQRLFCATRTPVVQVHELSAKSGKTLLGPQVDLGSGHHSEGMAAHSGWVWLAVHDGGLLAIDDSAPFAVQAVQSPAALKDAWDVATLGAAGLVVADGASGVALLDMNKKAAPQLLHKLALPGTAAFLAVQGQQVAVSTLGGGLHVVRLSEGGKLQLQGGWSSGGMVYGLSIDGGHVFAGVGGHVLALTLPGANQLTTGPLGLRALQPSPFYALDADPLGVDLVTAEFQGVRVLSRHNKAKDKTGLLVEPRIFAPLTAVGETLHSELSLRNVANDDLQIDSVRWFEAAGTAGLQVSGPVKVPAGGRVVVPISAPKTVKGVVAHGLVIASQDTLRPLAGVELIEVAQLQPGDKLPAMTYQDAAGKTVDVGVVMAGKVGVLLIAAETCPVAFYALASAKSLLAPWLATGKVAAVALNPWNKPADAPETSALAPGFPVLYTPLTTSDGHDWSEVLDVTLGQPSHHGPPMPIVYVVDAQGEIVLARWGWRPDVVQAAIEKALVSTP